MKFFSRQILPSVNDYETDLKIYMEMKEHKKKIEKPRSLREIKSYKIERREYQYIIERTKERAKYCDRRGK